VCVRLTAFPTLKDTGLKTFHGFLKQIDGMLADHEWFFDRYTVLDPYGVVFYTWGARRQLPMTELQELHSIQEPDAQTASCRTCGG